MKAERVTTICKVTLVTILSSVKKAMTSSAAVKVMTAYLVAPDKTLSTAALVMTL